MTRENAARQAKREAADRIVMAADEMVRSGPHRRSWAFFPRYRDHVVPWFRYDLVANAVGEYARVCDELNRIVEIKELAREARR